MNDTKSRNITRTWKLDLYGSYGEGRSASVAVGSRMVTLAADQNGSKTALIDGQPAELDQAVRLLEWAKAEGRVTLVSEVRTSQPIGKARAAQLHRLMGRAGLPSAQHYALAAAALGEWAPLPSLAALTEAEARIVWCHLCRLYPVARAAA